MALITKFSRSIQRSPNFQGMNKVNDERTSIFTSIKPYPMRLDWYVEHILYQVNIPEELVVCIYILLEKYLQQDLVCYHNLHKIVFTCFTVCVKFIIDPWIPNKALEKVGGIRNGSLSAMESTLLNFINWKLEFKKYKEIERYLLLFSIEETTDFILEEEEKDLESFEEESFTTSICSELEAFFAIDLLKMENS